jgi:hypothetical protein
MTPLHAKKFLHVIISRVVMTMIVIIQVTESAHALRRRDTRVRERSSGAHRVVRVQIILDSALGSA